MNRLLLLLTVALGTAAPHSRTVDDRARPSGEGIVAGTITTDTKLTTKGPVSQKDIVVYLVPKKPLDPAPEPTTAKVVQKKLNFTPHVLPILKGSSVEFQNEDHVQHNIFLESDCCPLNMDAEGGQTKSAKFAKEGVYPIVCRFHPEMSMHIVVLETPFFVTTEFEKNKDGEPAGFTASFRIEHVPPGTYELHTWNKKLKAIEKTVVVTADQTEKVELQASK